MRTYFLWIGIAILCTGRNAGHGRIISPGNDIIICDFFTTSDRIECPVAWWDELVKGTKFSSGNLITGKRLAVFIELADKYRGACNQGLGLGCSIYDNNEGGLYKPRLINHQQRQASAWLQKIRGKSVQLTFRDTIDWKSLAEGK